LDEYTLHLHPLQYPYDTASTTSELSQPRCKHYENGDAGILPDACINAALLRDSFQAWGRFRALAMNPSHF